MNVLHLSAECYPVAKTGGLGDVVGALPKYQTLEGIHAMVAIPFYHRPFVHENSFDVVFSSSSNLGQRVFDYQVFKESNDVLGFELYLIKIPGLLDREQIYMYPDETEQFVAYQIAVLDWIVKSGKPVDVFHCHDHHSGLVPFLMKHSFRFNSLKDKVSICTIHNGQYQGWMGWEKFHYLPDVDNSKTGLLEWNDCINPLAASVKCCWKYTTVSESYLAELREQSNGLEFLFEIEKGKGVGILNGIDPDVWNPSTDPMIAKKYGVTSFSVGKNFNKREVCKEFSLDSEKLLITFIGRLVFEKGADKLPEAIKVALTEYDGDISVLILGSGEKNIEESLKQLTDEFANYNVFIGYNEALSHRIYAGADFILMPSRVEPCGLNQLYALKYGTVPVVRTTGGLKDSIIDIDEEGGYGIRFNHSEVDDIVEAIGRSLELYQDTARINNIRSRMMKLDFSWNKSAQQYNNLYKSLIP